MTTLEFTLIPEACGRVYDALTCLAKFSDSVTIEARSSQFVLAALNSSKTAYVCMTLEPSFFTHYSFVSHGGPGNDKFSCQMLNKALSSVFKGRLVDPKQRESAVERCQVRVHDTPEQTRCRFNVKMICRHGVTKRYQLTYEAVETMRALFDKDRATNNWKIQAKHLREYIEHFAPKTEQLDIYPEEGRCTFLSFTEKIMNGKEILKQPLQTAVAIQIEDFIHFNVIDNLHVVINVKDFKHMVTHAETLKTAVTAMYSRPSRPLQFNYAAEGMQCDFTLMTIGDTQSAPVPDIPRASSRLAATVSGHGPQVHPNTSKLLSETSAAAQTRSLGRRMDSAGAVSRNPPDPESLFVPDDDRQWEPFDEHEEDQDMLGWDASGENDSAFRGTFREGASTTRPFRDNGFDDAGIAPTQKASQIRGLFD